MTEQWKEMYMLAKDFFTKYDDLLIPQRYEINNKKLGYWISKQRSRYKKGELTDEEIALLDKIDMVWDATKYRGISLPEQILFFYIKKTFCNAINTYIDLGYEIDVFVPELKLGIEYDGGLHKAKNNEDIEKNKKCEKDKIFLIRIREPECSSLNFNSRYYKEFHLLSKNKFFDEYSELISNILLFISSKFNITYSIDIDIKRDITDIMDFYKKSSCMLWERQFKSLEKWYQEHGNLIIPTDFIVNDISLEKWLKRQRINYRRGILTKHQIRSLESLNISWEPYDELWEQNYNLLKEYKKEYGNINILKHLDIYKGQKLGNWLFKQRQAYIGTKDRRKMTVERIKLLEDLGIIWDPFQESWNNHYKYIKEQYDRGIKEFKSDFKTDNDFWPSKWISKQKTNYKKGKLSEERIQKLREIGIIE